MGLVLMEPFPLGHAPPAKTCFEREPAFMPCCKASSHDEYRSYAR